MAQPANPPPSSSGASSVDPSVSTSMPTSTVTIRLANADDATTICAVGARVFTSTFAHTCTAQQLQDFLAASYSPAAITRVLRDTSKTTLVAVGEGGYVVGFAMLARGTTGDDVDHLGDKAEIKSVYVDEAHHGKGVAHQLLRDVEALAVAEGIRHLSLSCAEYNARGLRFYEKTGYRRVGRAYVDVGGDVQAGWNMVKDL